MAPLLQTRGTQRPPSVVANISARVGSLGDNRSGGWWSYRMSKAALNMATRNMAGARASRVRLRCCFYRRHGALRYGALRLRPSAYRVSPHDA